MVNSDIEERLINLLTGSAKKLLPFEGEVRKNKRESPDYCLYSDSIKVGIEITRSMDQNLAKICVERDKLDKKKPFVPIVFENQNMTSKEIKAILMKPKLIGRPYKGDGLECVVFSNIRNSIEKKISKFENYTKFDENWIYIHHKDRASLEKEKVIGLVEQYIITIDLKFDVFLLKLGSCFYKFNGNGLICRHKLIF